MDNDEEITDEDGNIFSDHYTMIDWYEKYGYPGENKEPIPRPLLPLDLPFSLTHPKQKSLS